MIHYGVAQYRACHYNDLEMSRDLRAGVNRGQKFGYTATILLRALNKNIEVKF